jgi:hypothetical protein
MSEDTVQQAWCGECGHQYEDPSAVAATPGDQRPPCPRCGSHRVSFGMMLSATAATSASMTGHKPPGSGGESVRVARGGEDPRVAGADVDPAGELSDHVEGHASSKDSSELRAATVLVEHLNAGGAHWGPPTLYRGKEIGVDAVTADGAERLQIQVTTPERSAWALLAKQHRVERLDPGVHDAVDAIKAAIEDKTLFSELGEIVLALDATDSPRYALRAVADAFLAQHVAWAGGIGYQAIWLVGPVAELVHRLDV